MNYYCGLLLVQIFNTKPGFLIVEERKKVRGKKKNHNFDKNKID